MQSVIQYKALITDLFILDIHELYVSLDASTRTPFLLNYEEFTHSFHKQLLVVLTNWQVSHLVHLCYSS